jgi:hypothetical protein
MPEPAPVGSTEKKKETIPDLIPGGLTPEIAPMGPPCELDLPANHPSAFQCENYPPEEACYLSAGGLAFHRQHYGHGIIAYLDPSNVHNGIVPVGLPTPITVLRNNDITPDFNLGGTATIGYLFHDEAVELTGFYIPKASASTQAENQGRLDTPFYHPPLGIDGDNGQFTHADIIRTTASQTLGGAELNFRSWNAGIKGVELIMGVRYAYFQESLGIFVDDDGLTFVDAFGRPDPKRQATVTFGVENNIIAPQLGFDWEFSLLGEKVQWLWFGVSGKAALGVDLQNATRSVVRGDGFVGSKNSQADTSFGQIYDLGAHLDFHLLERCRLRFAYTGLWLVGVATAEDRLNYNLSSSLSETTKNGSVFYHGPTIELQFLF